MASASWLVEGAVFGWQHDGEAVELVADDAERDFLKEEPPSRYSCIGGRACVSCQRPFLQREFGLARPPQRGLDGGKNRRRGAGSYRRPACPEIPVWNFGAGRRGLRRDPERNKICRRQFCLRYGWKTD
jgi:hypothetical protein